MLDVALDYSGNPSLENGSNTRIDLSPSSIIRHGPICCFPRLQFVVGKGRGKASTKRIKTLEREIDSGSQCVSNLFCAKYEHIIVDGSHYSVSSGMLVSLGARSNHRVEVRGDLNADGYTRALTKFSIMEDVLHFIFGILGNVFGAALFFAPVGSTEDFSGVPYVTSVFNCLLYTWYGLPLVTSNNILVSTTDGLGAALETVYTCLFLIYAPPKYRIKILGLFVAVLILFGVIALSSVMALHHTARMLLVGSIAAALSVCMYAAPLSIMVFSPGLSMAFLVEMYLSRLLMA
eukprot:Gb_17608 [translate_table: standard]